MYIVIYVIIYTYERYTIKEKYIFMYHGWEKNKNIYKHSYIKGLIDKKTYSAEICMRLKTIQI